MKQFVSNLIAEDKISYKKANIFSWLSFGSKFQLYFERVKNKLEKRLVPDFTDPLKQKMILDILDFNAQIS